jgi:hypothetical protein
MRNAFRAQENKAFGIHCDEPSDPTIVAPAIGCWPSATPFDLDRQCAGIVLLLCAQAGNRFAVVGRP